MKNRVIATLLIVGIMVLGSGIATADTFHWGMGNHQFWEKAEKHGMFYIPNTINGMKIKDLFNRELNGTGISVGNWTIFTGYNSTNNITTVIEMYHGYIAYEYTIKTPKANPEIIPTPMKTHVIISYNYLNVGKLNIILHSIDTPRLIINMNYGLFHWEQENRYAMYLRVPNSNVISNFTHGNIISLISTDNSPVKYSVVVMSSGEMNVSYQKTINGYVVQNNLNETENMLFYNLIIKTIQENSPIFTFIKEHNKFAVNHCVGEISMFLTKNNSAVYSSDMQSNFNFTVAHIGKYSIKIEISSKISVDDGGYIIIKVNKDVWNSKIGTHMIVILDGKLKFKQVSYKQIMNLTARPENNLYNITSFNSSTYEIIMYITHFSTHEVTFEKANTGIYGFIQHWKIQILLLIAIVIILFIPLYLIKRKKNNGGKQNWYYKEIEVE